MIISVTYSSGEDMRQPTWYDAWIWLAFTILGFMGPLMIGLVVRAASGSDIDLQWLAGAGQFAMSSAGLLMTTAYFVARPGSFSRLPLTEWFMISSFVGLLISVTLFILATLESGGLPIDSRFYLIPSIVLFGIALVIAFVAVGLDRNREIDDPGFLERNRRTEQAKIEDGFDSTF